MAPTRVKYILYVIGCIVAGLLQYWVTIHCQLRGRDVEEMPFWEIFLGGMLGTVVVLGVLILPIALAFLHWG